MEKFFFLAVQLAKPCLLCIHACMHKVFYYTFHGSPHFCISDESSATLKKAAVARLAVCNSLSENRNFGIALPLLNKACKGARAGSVLLLAGWLANCGLQREAICKDGRCAGMQWQRFYYQWEQRLWVAPLHCVESIINQNGIETRLAAQ